MRSSVIKRSVIIAGGKTSISIEEPFWQTLKQIAKDRGVTVSTLIASIKERREQNSNLSSAIRVFVLSHVRTRMADLMLGQDHREPLAVARSAERVP